MTQQRVYPSDSIAAPREWVHYRCMGLWIHGNKTIQMTSEGRFKATLNDEWLPGVYDSFDAAHSAFPQSLARLIELEASRIRTSGSHAVISLADLKPISH